MAPKAKSETLLGLSMADARIIILGTLLDPGKIDYEKLAQKGGYKNAASASTTYRNARRKLVELHGADMTNNDASAAPTADGQSTNETPKKAPAKRKSKAAAAEADPGAASPDGAAEGAETAVPKPKRQRKAPTKKAAAVKAEKEEYETNPITICWELG
ncbi:hypothetical protein AWENTII_004216 [Aspergillus wentii]